MTAGWEEKLFAECIEPVRWDRALQIRSSNYLPSGEYPIVDQGQGLIAGWTNNGEAVLKDGLPYIVFGDHTRLVKYVDFPFALGADGTKLINLSEDINPRYFYYALSSLDIPSRGYSRHYRLLKEKEIPLPPLPEQKKIAAVLLKIQRAIETQDKIIQSLRDLKKSTMQNLFTHGPRGEKTKMTDIGEIPESWGVVPLSNVSESSAFGPRFGADLYSEDGNVTTLRTTDISRDGHIDYSEAPRASLNLERFESHLLQYGDCVVTRSGTCGIAAVFEGHDTAVLPGAFLIRVRLTGELLPHFLRQYINSPTGQQRILTIARGAIQKNISGTSLLAFTVPIPTEDEQEEINAALDAVDIRIRTHETKKTALQDLFKTTLNKLMAGDIRVADLDIDVKEVEM